MTNPNFLIDLVVPYVDNTDPIWQHIHDKYTSNIGLTKQSVQVGDNNNSKNRFRSQGDFFRYFFRCVEKNMPWINKIFLLVMIPSQVPTWIDTNKVTVITHNQFIPKEFLPTFNSGTIEMFLWNIPGLSEHFIYANDDMFVLKTVAASNFFTQDKCKFNYLQDTDVTRNEWRQMCQNNHDLIFGTKKAIPYIRLDHEFRPYLKSVMARDHNIYKREIAQSISQFRSAKNLTVFLFSLSLLKNKLQEQTELSIGYLSSTSSERNIRLKLKNSDTVCLNDTAAEVDIYSNAYIRYFFYSNFNHKSKYELFADHTLTAKNPDKQKSYGQANTYLYF